MWHTRNFFCPRWASPLNQTSLIVGWLFYNFKSFKRNGSASLFGKRNKKTFNYIWALVRATHSAIVMAGPHTWQSPCRNPPLVGEDELAGTTPGAIINDNDTLSHTPNMSRVPTLTAALPLTPAKLVAKYTKADL